MSDLIDKKEFISWLDNWFSVNRYYHPHSKLRNIPYGEVLDILKQIPTVPPAPRWVRCEEELPPTNTNVLVCRKGFAWNGEPFITVTIDSFTIRPSENIVAWMPLPEPPKEG